MLAPGDHLILPPENPHSGPPVTRGGTPTTPSTPPAEVEEPEQRSFLLILLRALGAVHT